MPTLRVLLLVLVLLTAAGVTFACGVYFQFKNASYDATVRMGFSELIRTRIERGGDREGAITLPVDASTWGDHPATDYFAEAINQLDAGVYTYFVFDEGGDLKFRVLDEHLQEVSAGFVAKPPITY